MTTPSAPPRRYEARATTSDRFGRVAATVRGHVLVVDGPVRNGAPGEAPTPGELVLAAVASCAAEVLQVLAAMPAFPSRPRRSPRGEPSTWSASRTPVSRCSAR